MTSDGRYVSKELCFLIGQYNIALVSNTIYIDVTIINICSARGFAICCIHASGKKKKDEFCLENRRKFWIFACS